MASYINLDALLKYPIRRSNYDKEHGSEEFINGVESVIEYAKSLHTIESPVGHAYWTEREIVNSVPTEDVQPVVHGKWGERYFCGSGYMYVCSNCGYDSEETNYCAKCGAKMR